MEEQPQTSALTRLESPEATLPLTRHIELLLFISPEPLSVEALLEQLTAADPNREEVETEAPAYTFAEVRSALEALSAQYAAADTLWELRQMAGGVQLVTKAVYAPWVRKARLVREKKRLSRAALEVLAIIAYRQPITRAEVEYVRGVNSDYAISKLLEKQLIEPAGRADLPGRPITYQTTRAFLEYFALGDRTELPTLHEIRHETEGPEAEFVQADPPPAPDTP